MNKPKSVKNKVRDSVEISVWEHLVNLKTNKE